MSFGAFWGLESLKKRKNLAIMMWSILTTHPYILTLEVNPKEYLELFESKYLNKKHKGIQRIIWPWF